MCLGHRLSIRRLAGCIYMQPRLCDHARRPCSHAGMQKLRAHTLTRTLSHTLPLPHPLHHQVMPEELMATDMRSARKRGTVLVSYFGDGTWGGCAAAVFLACVRAAPYMTTCICVRCRVRRVRRCLGSLRLPSCPCLEPGRASAKAEAVQHCGTGRLQHPTLTITRVVRTHSQTGWPSTRLRCLRMGSQSA